MSARKEKGKKKSEKQPKEESPPKITPINIHFKITAIKNVLHFNKLNGNFSLEIYHCKNLLNETSNGGKFNLRRVSLDDLLMEGEIDMVDLNLHYVLTIRPDNYNDFLTMADCPILFVLNLLTSKTHDDSAGSEEMTDEVNNKIIKMVKTKIEKSKEDLKKDIVDESGVTKKAEVKNNAQLKISADTGGNEKVAKKNESEDKNEQKGKKGRQKDHTSSAKTQSETDIEKHTQDEGEDDENQIYKIPVGFGVYDLVNLITTDPIDTQTELYLYPEIIYPNIKTPKIIIRIYSVNGVLQNTTIRFCNIASFKMESLFNISDLFQEFDTQVHVDVSLINPQDSNEKLNLFTFSDGSVVNFEIHDRYISWAGIPKVGGVGSLLENLESNELKGIYVDNLKLLSTAKEGSPVYTFDSIHRYFFTEEDVLNLEHLINYYWDQICLEVRLNDNEEPSFIGYADLAPLLYPDVRKGRFCVIFKPYSKTEVMEIFKDQAINKQSIQKPSSPKVKSLLPGEFIPTTAPQSPKQMKGKEVKKETKGKKPKHSKTEMKSKEMSKGLKVEFFAIFTVEFNKPITERSLTAECDITKLTGPKCYCNDVSPPSLEKLAKMYEREFENEVITIVKRLPVYVDSLIVQTSSGPRIDCDSFKKLTSYAEMKDNLMDKITKFVATKYNVQNPTNTNEDFKDLMVTVFNDLRAKIDTMINDYFAGVDSFIEISKMNQAKDLKIFTAKEARQLSFKHIVEDVWTDLLDEEEDEDEIIDLIINELESLNLKEAAYWLSKLMNINSNNYYGMLISLYFKFIKNEAETEIYLSDLIELTKAHPNKIPSWALLYVFFSSVSYRAGYKHAKMNYELYNPPKYPHFWKRKEMFFNIPETESPLCYSLYLFLKIGLYKFAEIIYSACKEEFKEPQQRYLKCLILYLQNNKEELKKYLKSISSEKNEILVRLFRGYMDYEDDNFKAIMNYQITFHSTLRQGEYYHVAFLRCGYWDIKNKNYEDAMTYFSTCSRESNSFLSLYGLGICCFRLEKLEEAELCFSKATNLFSKLAEIWIYLALVNVKLGRYSKAEECLVISKTQVLCDGDLWDEMVSTFNECNVKLPAAF